MIDDVRTAWRGLRSAAGTTATAFLLLTIGIAAATITFSVVDAVTLRSLPLPDADRLIAISKIDARSPRPGPVAPQDFFSWQDRVPAFEGLAAVGFSGLGLKTETGVESLVAFRATPNLFDVLHVRPALGRTFAPEHAQAGRDKVVVLSHGLWQRRFGGDDAIIGRHVAFGADTREIIGVMPAGFTYPIGPDRPTDAWVPNVPRATDRDHSLGGRGYYMLVVGRLRAGATVELAQAQVAAVTAQITAEYPSTFWKDARPVVTTLHERVVGPAHQWLVLMLGAVGLILLIAYVNVANLLIARAGARGRDLATRAALGASRVRLARTLLFEGLILSAGAAAAGIALSFWGLSLVLAVLPEGLARASSIAVDARVLLVAVTVAIGTGVLFGLLPAWHGVRTDLLSVMKAGSGAVVGGRGRARWMRVLLASEVAFVVTLLVAMALFVTSFIRVMRADLGFERERVVGFRVSKGLDAAGDAARLAAVDGFVGDLIARVQAVPGVEGAAFAEGGLPLSGNSVRYSIEVDGFGETSGADMLELRGVSAGYFSALGMRLIDGRGFEAGDRAGAPHVAVINEEAARRFFGANAVGRTFQFRARTIVVGVVADSRLGGPESAVRPELYVPLTQNDTRDTSVNGDLVVRTAGPPEVTVPAIQHAIREVLGASTSAEPHAINDAFQRITATRRFNAGVMAVLGAIALLMGGAGVYGVMAFAVSQQVRALGLRIALGATRGRILRAVLTDAARTVGAGIAIGLGIAWLVSGVFTAVIFGVEPSDLSLYAGVAAAAAVAAFVAAMVPALRATRVDPLVALRLE